MRLNDKIAIITGASRGIGEAISIGFAKEGSDSSFLIRNSRRCSRSGSIPTFIRSRLYDRTGNKCHWRNGNALRERANRLKKRFYGKKES